MFPGHDNAHTIDKGMVWADWNVYFLAIPFQWDIERAKWRLYVKATTSVKA
jgi:hypothetical protein